MLLLPALELQRLDDLLGNPVGELLLVRWRQPRFLGVPVDVRHIDEHVPEAEEGEDAASGVEVLHGSSNFR